MRPVDFAEVAAHLDQLEKYSEQGSRRSALSRFYYAAFLRAVVELQSKRGFKFKNNEVHEMVLQAFTRSDDGELYATGRLLSELRKSRRTADYDLEPRFETKDVKTAGQLHDQIVKVLETNDLLGCVDPDPRRTGLQK